MQVVRDADCGMKQRNNNSSSMEGFCNVLLKCRLFILVATVQSCKQCTTEMKRKCRLQAHCCSLGVSFSTEVTVYSVVDVYTSTNYSQL